MKKRLLLNIFVVVVLIALTATATWAYFHNMDTEYTTVTTAKIGIQAWAGFPLTFDKMLPGDWMTKEVAVKNTSNVKADFFVQLEPYDPGVTEINFCYDTGGEVLDIKIDELWGSAGSVKKTWYNGTICRLYPYQANALIPQIADDVAAGEVKYFNISLYLKTTADNTYMDAINKDVANLIAVQYNGPAPQADLTSAGIQWPNGDPNY